MTPAQHDFTIWRGNDSRDIDCQLIDETGANINLTGYEIVFRAVRGGVEILRKTRSAMEITDATGHIVVPLTFTETRAMGIGERIDYEIETRSGSRQETWVYGRLIPAGGVNDDS